MNWEELIDSSNGNYELIVKNLEQSIRDNPSQSISYHYLGLVHLLHNQKEKYTNIWHLGYANTSSCDSYWKELYKLLEKEAICQEEKREYLTSLNIRAVIRQFLPEDFNNLVQTFYLLLQLESVNPSTLEDLGIYETINLKFAQHSTDQESSDKKLLLQLIVNALSSKLPEAKKIEFVSFTQEYFTEKEKLFNYIVPYVFQLTSDSKFKLLKLILENCPNHLSAFSVYNNLLTDTAQFDKAIQTARNYLDANQNDLIAKVVGNHLLLAALINFGSKWEKTQEVQKDHTSLISEVIAQELKTHNFVFLNYFLLSSFFTVYFYDHPTHWHSFQNQVSRLFHTNIRSIQPEIVERFQRLQAIKETKPLERKIKIGFLSTTLRQHSVGWLARFLIDNLDRKAFELYGYFPEYRASESFLQTWYINKMHKVFRPVSGFAHFYDVANEIADDKIDILVDLESITSALCSQILALKPAPIQVTWLGWDASGIPAIDYYIADHHVLPENAQAYYSEKIWRLPNAYLAIDGFEISVPSLTRESLEIPEDAIIYFSSQTNRKRHPEIVSLQMQILKEVPNSYFLIKGYKNNDRIEQFFREISELEGVRWDQLRFIPLANNEFEHRANLSIADVILDTYPYNGATTTMEVLWMGIPLVTRVGEQFVARNSYTMLKNVGVTEGIAWTPEEYVNWGVRFGTEPDLRRDVAWKLKQSRKTSPLWNSKQFTRNMEDALKQMWEIHNG